jgi:hypothetical protein
VGITAQEAAAFQDLISAVAFIASRLESLDCAGLYTGPEKAGLHTALRADSRVFSVLLCSPLSEHHREQELRVLYQKRKFPAEADQFNSEPTGRIRAASISISSAGKKSGCWQTSGCAVDPKNRDFRSFMLPSEVFMINARRSTSRWIQESAGGEPRQRGATPLPWLTRSRSPAGSCSSAGCRAAGCR